MQFQHTTTLPSIRVQGRKLLLVAGGAALALAVAAGSWQTLIHQDSPTVAPVQPSVAIAAPVVPTAASVVRPQAAAPLTIYITRSQDQADLQRQAIEDGNNIRAQLGLPPFDVAVVVAASAEEEQMFTAFHSETNAIRASMGLNDIPLISATGR